MEIVVRELRKDADLGVFLNADCNVSAIASAVVARDSVSPGLDRGDAFRRSSIASLDESSGGAPSHSEQFIQKIDEAVHRIDRVISEHVTEHHMELLGQVGSVDGLQSQVSSVQSSVQHLKSAVDALESNVREQHRKLQVTIQKHRNVEQCGDIVRRVLRFHQLSERVLGSPLATAGLLSMSNASGSNRGMDAANHAEMVTLALAIREMETLVEDPNFEELSVVRSKLPAIRKLSAAVKRDVRANLRTGMQNVSQAEVGDALQVLFYLGGLAPTVQGAVNDVIQEVERACGAAIAEEKLYRRNSLATGTNGTSNSSGGGGDAGSSVTHAVVQKADIWKAIQDVFEEIRTHAIQVWNLQRVLVKMVDPTTNSRYIDLVIDKDEPTLFATFWEVTCAIVRELFASMLSYRSAVKTVLVSEYPRMREQAHRVLNDLYAATNQNAGSDYNAGQSAGSGKSVAKTFSIGIAGSPAERSQLLDSMSPLYDAFTERLYRRLSNPIQLMFPQSSNFHASPPGRSDMQTLARTIFAELDQVGNDPVLLEGSLKQIRKAVTLFCTNVKKIMNTGKTASATTPSFGRTAAQVHNVSLITVLGILDDAVEEVERRIEAAATESAAAANAETTRSMSMVRVSNDDKITEKQAKSVCAKELTPCHDMIGDMEYALLGYYLQSLASILEGIFAKMHDESFADRAPNTPGASAGGAQQRHSMGGGLSSLSTNGSKYMQEFTSVFAVILDEHLRRLPSSSFVTECVGDFVCRLISVFVRHASLLRPLQENGKLRLANDMAQLESWLEHIMPLKNLGAPYDELRAFRQLIFLENASLLRDPAVDKIRPSNVWHHLIARAPPELQLPHQMKRWNVSKYVDWLDTEVPVDIRAAFTPPPGPFAWKDLPLGYPCLKDRRLALLTEKSVWKEVTKCLDAYAQRVSAASGVDLSPVYELVQESGPILLAGYEVAYPV